jgi:hypothetical protein
VWRILSSSTGNGIVEWRFTTVLSHANDISLLFGSPSWASEHGHGEVNETILQLCKTLLCLLVSRVTRNGGPYVHV